MMHERKAIGKFEINSIVLLFLSIFSSAMGYLYQIALGNILSVESYGNANTLVTYISTASMIVQPICLLVSRNIAIYRAEQKEQDLNNFMAVILEITVVICLFICVFIVCIGFLHQRKLGTPVYLLCFSVTLITNIVYLILLYTVQGFKQFIKYGVIGFICAIMKILTVIIGNRYVKDASLAMFSLTIANVICILLILCPSRNGSIIRRYKRQNIIKWLPSIISFYSWTFPIQILLNFIINGGDIILIKYAFTDRVSGIYAVSSILCRVAIIGLSPILTILYTDTASNLGNEDSLRKLVNKVLVYCTVIAGTYFLLLNVFAEWLVNFLYGERYTDALQFFPATSFFVITVIWLNIFCHYYIAIGKVKILVAIMCFIVLGVLLLALVATTVNQILIALGIIICIGDGYCYYKTMKEIKSV